MTWGAKGFYPVVLNSHNIDKLLVMLERIPSHVAWIFTTTMDGQESLFDSIDASPLLSRCLRVKLAQRGLAEAFARDAQRIARLENLDGQDLSVYLRAVKECRNNQRAVLNRIDAGEMLR